MVWASPKRARVVRLWCLVSTLLFVFAAPVQGQLSDSFAGHFGASRTMEPGIKWSASLGVMLLTQFGSRWVPDDTVYWQYDQLQTTVGYNYAQGGLQWSWPWVALGGTPVVSAALTLGMTSDRWTRTGQDGLHDFRRFPHVQRRTVDNGVFLVGGELEALYWWSFPVWIFRFDVHPHVAGLWSTFHREASGGLALGAGVWKLRLQGSYWKGWLFAQSGVHPAAVGARLTDGYRRWDVSLAFDRNRYGGLKRYIPAVGLAIAGSSGIFQNEDETLLSIFFDFPSVSNDSFRLEAVNDLLASKDRGPTGGLRLTYVRR